MSIEKNKQVVRRWIDAGVNGGDLSVADELFEADVLAHAPEGDVRGVDEGPKASVEMLRGAFPDLHFAIEDLIGEGDKVAALFVAQGSHRGDFMGIAPTGRSVSFKGDVRLPAVCRTYRRSVGFAGRTGPLGAAWCNSVRARIRVDGDGRRRRNSRHGTGGFVTSRSSSAVAQPYSTYCRSPRVFTQVRCSMASSRRPSMLATSPT